MAWPCLEKAVFESQKVVGKPPQPARRFFDKYGPVKMQFEQIFCAGRAAFAARPDINGREYEDKMRIVMSGFYCSGNDAEQKSGAITRAYSPTTQRLQAHYSLTVRRRKRVK